MLLMVNPTKEGGRTHLSDSRAISKNGGNQNQASQIRSVNIQFQEAQSLTRQVIRQSKYRQKKPLRRRTVFSNPPSTIRPRAETIETKMLRTQCQREDPRLQTLCFGPRLQTRIRSRTIQCQTYMECNGQSTWKEQVHICKNSTKRERKINQEQTEENSFHEKIEKNYLRQQNFCNFKQVINNHLSRKGRNALVKDSNSLENAAQTKTKSPYLNIFSLKNRTNKNKQMNATARVIEQFIDQKKQKRRYKTQGVLESSNQREASRKIGKKRLQTLSTKLSSYAAMEENCVSQCVVVDRKQLVAKAEKKLQFLHIGSPQTKKASKKLELHQPLTFLHSKQKQYLQPWQISQQNLYFLN